MSHFRDHKPDNFTDYLGVHHTQPTYAEAKAELWEAYNEMVKRNEAWRRQWDKGGSQQLNVEASNRYHDLELLKLGE